MDNIPIEEMPEEIDRLLEEIERKDYLLKEQGKELKDLYKENERYCEVINELTSKISKAIEYIESYLPNYSFDKTNLRKLLEILNKAGEE